MSEHNPITLQLPLVPPSICVPILHKCCTLSLQGQGSDPKLVVSLNTQKIALLLFCFPIILGCNFIYLFIHIAPCPFLLSFQCDPHTLLPHYLLHFSSEEGKPQHGYQPSLPGSSSLSRTRGSLPLKPDKAAQPGEGTPRTRNRVRDNRLFNFRELI